MQEVKISLQIGEITHEIGEKKTTGRQDTQTKIFNRLKPFSQLAVLVLKPIIQQLVGSNAFHCTS